MTIPPRLEIINALVCVHFNLPPTVMQSKCRKPAYVLCRYTAMTLAQQLTPHTQKQIAEVFGCDRTLISRAPVVINEKRNLNKRFYAEFADMTRRATTTLNNAGLSLDIL